MYKFWYFFLERLMIDVQVVPYGGGGRDTVKYKKHRPCR